ncbi:transporter [Roseateles violae]|uniref:Transporter n=1 Tax=Roseateles violae TaxID=3058042 RepID=A0ABT8DPW4_9BURK|nr:transporter [Pelomonas sp. PFR6]MDN3918979.1 transporter [Pelomonas sp. PFR6]
MPLRLTSHPARHRCAATLLALLAGPAAAQELEPRAYSNLPTGLNFLIAAYAHSRGGLSTEPSLPVEDAHLQIDTALIAYARSLDLWGRSGKVDLIVPVSQLSGSALVAGQPREREVSGSGDPRLRLSMNFLGAPALSTKEFAGFQPDLVVGASVQVGIPIGQYDPSKLINLGTNRWSLKPDIGFSKTFDALTVDLTAGVTLFGHNDDYFGGQRLEQAPIYSIQTNISHAFAGGIWAALGATYYSGGRTTLNGVRKDDGLANTRVGLTLALPINRRHSIKFNASGGISTRTGTDFDTLGVAWQYRWGAGI